MNKIEAFIDRKTPVISGVTTISEAKEIFIHTGKRILPLLDDGGKPLGLLHDNCLLFAEAHSLAEACVDRHFFTIHSKERLEAVLKNHIENIRGAVVAVNEDGIYEGLLYMDSLVKIFYHDVKYIENVLDSIDVGILAIDKDKKITFFNEEYRRIHSIKGDSLLGEDVLGNFPETFVVAVLDNAESYTYPDPLYLKYSGATVLPFYTPIRDEENNIVGSLGLVRDYNKISDLSISVRELKSLNAFFSSIFNNLSEMVFSVDNDMIITYSNPAFQNVFGKMAAEQLTLEALYAPIQEAKHQGKRHKNNQSLTLCDQYGAPLYVSLSCLALTNAQGAVSGAVCILQNVTSLVELNEEVTRSASLLHYYGEQLSKLPGSMVCINEKFKEVMCCALKVAKVPISVLIEGENGVGKDMVANLIHSSSDRSQNPFIPVNCGAIPENLWESEMFGYEEGSFTGARKGGKLGLVELANHGTLFLDEVSEIPLAAQVKMLRFLENMEISKVGMTAVKKMDIRIISATNRNLEALVSEGRFREDLYYRLNIVHLNVPPLRERPEEIPVMAKNFVASFNGKYGAAAQMSYEVLEILKRQQWPGNVRQLRNVIEYAVVMCKDVIEPSHLPQHMLDMDAAPAKKHLQERLQKTEREAILEALAEAGNNRTKAIGLLHISRRTFYKKLKEYGLQ